MDSILNIVAGHELYNILNGFIGYNQVRMALEDEQKSTFVTNWGM